MCYFLLLFFFHACVGGQNVCLAKNGYTNQKREEREKKSIFGCILLEYTPNIVLKKLKINASYAELLKTISELCVSLLRL